MFISKKLGLEAGSRGILTSSGSSGLVTESSSSARARKNWTRSTSKPKLEALTVRARSSTSSDFFKWVNPQPTYVDITSFDIIKNFNV